MKEIGRHKGKKIETDDCYWSSSEKSSRYAYSLYPFRGTFYYFNSKGGLSYLARSVFKIN